MSADQNLTRARALLPLKSVIKMHGADIHLVSILPDEPPLSASWYKGKEVHLIAIDERGNFFLRQSSGAVAYYRHGAQTFQPISTSVKDFCSQLIEG